MEPEIVLNHFFWPKSHYLYFTFQTYAMRIIFLLQATVFFTTVSHSQTLHQPVVSPYKEFGSYSLKHADLFSVTGNKASLVQIKTLSAGLFAERKYLLEELNSFSAVAALPTRSGNFGLLADYSGFSGYNESQVGFAYARKLGSRIDAGVQFNYNRINIATYGSSAAVGFEVGVISHLTEKLHAGINVENPVGGKFGKNQEEKLPSVYAVGLGYDASEKVCVTAEIKKSENQPVNIAAGFQYKPVSQLLIRAGFTSSTSSFWAGAGLSLHSFRLDVMAAYHQQLGVTPGLMLLFNFNNKKDE